MRSQLKNISILFCQISLAAAVLLAHSAWPQNGDSIGTVLTARGDVVAQSSNGVNRPLKRRDSVYVGDTISAGEGARVRFKLLDDSTYVVQENSTFTIEEYNFNGSEDGTEVADFYFAEGVMEFVSGRIGKRDQTKFRIDTEFAAIGLRGSGGIITTGSGSTQVFVTLGQLTAVSKTGELFVLNNGQTTVLTSAGETTTEQGNSTGAEQTMTTDGQDIAAEEGDADEGDAQESEEEQSEEEQTEEQAEEQQQEQEQQEQAAEEVQDQEIAASDPDEEQENAQEDGVADDSGADGESGSESASTSDSGVDSSALSDAQLSAAEIYAELIPSDVEATQDDLAEALNQAVEAYPVLYAELVNVAIDAGLEPPTAAITATDALGGGGNVSESVVTEIFFVATEGLADTTDVDAALTAQGAPPLEAQGTGSAQVSVDAGSVGTDAPSNNASSPVSSASPAQ